MDKLWIIISPLLLAVVTYALVAQIVENIALCFKNESEDEPK